MLSRSARWQGLLLEIRHLAGGAYPSFVTSSRGDRHDLGLPVFVFHTIEPKEFEAALRYLTDNGYRSLDADSFLAVLTGRREQQGGEVLLTIDDGRSSAWVWGYPLLKRYGHRAVVFVIPGCVPDRARPLPRLGDPSSAEPPDDRDPELMSWTELGLAQADSVFDVQSHTMFHRQVPVSPEVVDFVTPWPRGPFYGVPLPLGVEASSAVALGQLAGLPIFRSEPLLGCSSIYAESPEVLDAPLELVRKRGAASFFSKPGWKRRLMSEVQRARESSAARGRWLEPSEIRRAVVKELADSKARIEERLENHVADHLCLPFSAGSETTVEVARQAGYRSLFWGVRGDRAANVRGDDPFHCVRLKHDYLFRLPGSGRRSLTTILFRKMLRRMRGEAVY